MAHEEAGVGLGAVELGDRKEEFLKGVHEALGNGSIIAPGVAKDGLAPPQAHGERLPLTPADPEGQSSVAPGLPGDVGIEADQAGTAHGVEAELRQADEDPEGGVGGAHAVGGVGVVEADVDDHLLPKGGALLQVSQVF